MPRRKQNTPKRLKSDDESDGETGNAVKKPDAEPRSDVEDDSMDDEHSQSELESEEEEEIMDDQSMPETNIKTTEDNDGVKETKQSVDDSAKLDDNLISAKSDDKSEECVDKKVVDKKLDNDVGDPVDKRSDVVNEGGKELSEVPSKKLEDLKFAFKHEKRDNENKEKSVRHSNSSDEPKENDLSKFKHIKETGVSHDFVNSRQNKDLSRYSARSSEKPNLSEYQKDKKEKQKPKVTDSSKTKVKADAESPISKLLNMVNNPEKIQTKHSYSNSFSLAASSPKLLSGIPPPKSSMAPPVSSTSATTSSSQLRSSKPLSGFLPPYNMYSQLQSMYSKMHHLAANNHSKDEKASTPSSLPPSPGPKKNENKSSSSPSPSPTATDQEQPLDLSVKSKGLDLSVKSKNELEEQMNDKHEKRSLKTKFIPSASSMEGLTSSDVSSLKSLEEKFGGNPFKMDKTQRGPKPFMPYMHPMLPMYGGALYTPALFSTHPWMHTEKLPRSEISPRKINPNPPSSPSKTSNHSSSEVRSPNKLSPTLVSKIPDKEIFYNKKYTNLKCSCKKEFETLYQLTIHLKQTGHTPSSRVSGQQEFPKLVRGQDMWLNHGSEQTKQILRCIRCGESFKTLPDLTVHMMKTKHYANIVGAESNRKLPNNRQPSELSEMDIYKCFQCEESFSGMEDFSKHMLSSGHHKNPIVIQPMSPKIVSPGSERTTPKEPDSREPSPKRLRTFSEASSGGVPSMVKLNDKFKYDRDNFSDRDENSWDSFTGEDNKIRCETCGDKIEMSKFVEHVRQCVRNSSWDYNTPLKKRRLDNDEKGRSYSNSVKSEGQRPSSVSSIDDRIHNGRHTPSSPKSVEGSRHTPLVQPSDTNSNDGSALRAMESFIEQSFTPSKKEKPNFFGFSPLSRSVFPMPFVNGHSPKSPSRNSAPPVNSCISSLYNKYLPPLYLQSSEASAGLNEGNKDSDVKPEKPIFSPMDKVDDKNAIKKIEITNENNNKEIVKTQENHSDVNSNHSDMKESRESLTPSPNSLREKYLNVAEREPTTPSSVKVESKPSNTSALESLQGLVYGKSFESDHPLDSLQKLIHNTEGQPREIPNGAYDAVMSNRPLLKEAFPSSALLKSSMMAGFPGGGLSSPQSPSKSESSVSPAPGSHASDRRTPDLSSENEGGKAPSEDGGDAEKSDSQGEYICQACSRSFATIGTYRFHTSRCHLSKAKKYQYSKETLNKTPYVYLPLDHSAKFNKYYEMANELANKTK